MSRILFIAALWLGLGVSTAFAQGPSDGRIQVTVDGAARKAGVGAYPVATRLSAVMLAAGVSADSYPLGAAWTRVALRDDQAKLRAGLLFELGTIRRTAIGSGNDVLAKQAQGLQAWLATLPVTGRRVATVLDPYRLEVTPADDWTVADGDVLFFPQRPAAVRVVGAVEQSCKLPLVPLQDARMYLEQCRVSAAADRSRIFVVQPDGAVFEQGVALWKRDPPRPLAPGAWIYVPLDERALGNAADVTFNRDFADFLATQLLSEEGWR
jgi:hypothetical protein